MIAQDTAIDALSVRHGLLATSLAATLATAAFYLSETHLTIVLACVAGAMSGLYPVWQGARQSAPKDVAALMALGRVPTRNFVIWLAMMVVYLLVGQPLGLPLFEFITGWCLSGLFFTRLAFPAITILVWAFSPRGARANKTTT